MVTSMRYRWWVLLAGSLFVIGIVLGLTVSSGTGSNFLADELATLEQFSGSIKPFTVGMVVFLFIKNVIVLLSSFIFSPILCLLPVLALLLNGGLLSFASVIIVGQKSLAFLLAGILPHGIFEIPSMIIGEAAALSFGVAAITAIISKQRRKQLLPKLKENLKVLMIACALLAPAAVIETYATPLLLALFQ